MSKMSGEYSIYEFMDRIGMTEEMKSCIEFNPLSREEYEAYRSLFWKSIPDFLTALEGQGNPRQLALKLYTEFAYEARHWYRERQINEDIYFDTFHAIVIWAENCKRDYGEMGLERYDWIWRYMQCRIFKLGRLEYETIYGTEQKELNKRALEPEDLVLNLHIPRGEPLRLEACLDSFKRAMDFFEHPKEITCCSWLLAPALKEILPEDSNIIRFQSLFHIYDLDRERRHAELFVYHHVQENPADYSQDTSLRAALRTYLMEKGNPGSGFGMVKGEFLR